MQVRGAQSYEPEKYFFFLFISCKFFYHRFCELTSIIRFCITWQIVLEDLFGFSLPSTILYVWIWALKVIVYSHVQIMIFSFRWSQKDFYLPWTHSRMRRASFFLYIYTTRQNNHPQSPFFCLSPRTPHHIGGAPKGQRGITFLTKRA